MFHPVVESWFERTFGSPTEVQSAAWPAIVRGDHVLVSAPTGSGKTLTAFLFALNQLLTNAWTGNAVRVLYISPLKALNNDIRRNLIEPLSGLRTAFSEAGLMVPAIRAVTRSGDTPGDERRRMVAHPPEILITTPESLNLLLSSPRARAILSAVRTVILDEIHAVAGGKRGAQLFLSVERVAKLAGEIQRIGISATIDPLEGVARLLGGYVCRPGADDSLYAPRPVTIVESRMQKRIDVSVHRIPDSSNKEPDSQPAPPRTDVSDARALFWDSLTDVFRRIVHRNQSTLFFTNNRRHAEKISVLINRAEGREIVYSHHGSLSREMRSFVEQELKNGNLAGIVATSSLELGIDIGALDEVVLVGTPFGVASTLQRIGRAGHRVGDTSHGLLYPLHGHDYLLAAVTVGGVDQRKIEKLRPVRSPLDVLAQAIISMTGTEEWQLDELYTQIRCCDSFHDLSRSQFDRVIEMLAGRYAESRVRELRPRITVDRLTGKVRAREGALTLLYHSGGTIPDRGYFDLRLQGAGTKIGELDEEFVWERRVGEVFTLGAQAWRIAHIGSQDVEVISSERTMDAIPFWLAEPISREYSYSVMILDFLRSWNDRLDTDEFRTELTGRRHFSPEAADALRDYLELQRDRSGADLPHRNHLLVEHFSDPKTPAGAGAMRQIVLHTLWGGRVNRPFALALSAAWEAEFGQRLQVFVDNDAIMLMFPDLETDDDVPESMTEMLTSRPMVTPENFERLLRNKLESSGFFGAMFRENAGRALLLPRSSFNRRMPLWLNRLRSKRLLDVVRRFDDFPILVETWRSCLQDEFDLDATLQVLESLADGSISVSEVRTTVPTPFAEGMVWQQTNKFMYEGDDPLSGVASSLSDDALSEVMHSSYLRPRLAPDMVDEFEAKLQRTAPGLAPVSPNDFVDWVRERVAIPWREFLQLADAVIRDASGTSGDESRGAAAAGRDDASRGATAAGSDGASRGVTAAGSDGASRGATAAGSDDASRGATAAGSDDAGATVPEGESRSPGTVSVPPDFVSGIVSRLFLVRSERDGDPIVVHLEQVARVAGMVGIASAANPLRRGAILESCRSFELLSEGGSGPSNVQAAPLTSSGREVLERYLATRGGDEAEEAETAPPEVAAEVLRFYGPLRTSDFGPRWGLDPITARKIIEVLAEEDRILVDRFRENASGDEICDAANLEALLRLARRRRRPSLAPKSPETLVYFAALRQGVVHGAADLKHALEHLFGYPLAPEIWEREAFPARLANYYRNWLDTLLRESGLQWVGVGNKVVTFALESDVDLLVESDQSEGAAPREGTASIEDTRSMGDTGSMEDTGSLEDTGPLEDTRSRERAVRERQAGPTEQAAQERRAAPQEQTAPQQQAAPPDEPEEPTTSVLLDDEVRVLAELLGTAGRRTIRELESATGLNSETVTNSLWDLAWKGFVSSDSFEAVRTGVLSGFRAQRAATEVRGTIGTAITPGRANDAAADSDGADGRAADLHATPESRSALRPGTRPTLAGGSSYPGSLPFAGGSAGTRRMARRAGLDRWRTSRPLDSAWFALSGRGDDKSEGQGPGPLEAEEILRDRIRILLSRCGFVFRELLDRESGWARWSALFRTLRVMELSGELVSGYFFDGVGGIQFAFPSAVRMIEELRMPDPPPVYWMNAVDPASPCGLGLRKLPYDLPSRIPSTHLVFEGAMLVMTSRRSGSEVEFTTHATAARIPEYLELFRSILGRDCDPPDAIRVERINGEAARNSDLGHWFVDSGFRQEFRGYTLLRSYR